MESASESAKTKRLVGHRVASDKRSCGKVTLTIDGKTRVLQSVGELERLNKTDKVINLPLKRKESVQEAIYNTQLNDLPWDWSSSHPLVGTKRIGSTSTQRTL